MKLLIVEDASQVASQAAALIIATIQQKPRAVLGLATGETPLATYQLLVSDFISNQTDWKAVTTFNLDEYLGLKANDLQSYRYYMEQHLFQYLNLNKENIYFPISGDNVNSDYDALIAAKQGIDLQLLGLGTNGHIAFNEPGTSFTSKTHVVTLSEQTRQDNARFFDDLSEVPQQAVTMGIATILGAKQLLLLATGANKALAIKQLVTGKATLEWPCSALQHHSDLFVIVDVAAASLLDGYVRNQIITC